MMKDRVIDSLGKIDDDMIRSVDALRDKKRKRSQIKWGVLAACFCVVIALTPAVIPLFPPQGDTDELKGLEDSETFLFSGVEYMVGGGVDFIAGHYGLPEEITEELAGERAAYLKRDENGKLIETTEITGIELFEYAQDPCSATKILRYGDTWYPVIFLGVISEDGEQYVRLEFDELYHIFGIRSENDIEAVYVNYAANIDTEGTKIADAERIKSFYTCTVSLDLYSAEEFEQQAYKDCETKEEIQVVDDALREDYRQLVIETKSGRLLYMQLYPKTGWIRRLNSYYMTEDLTWLE